MPIIAITGTNTDVGKTIATAALALALREQNVPVVCIKPVQTGEIAGEGDIFTLEKLTGTRGIEFIRFPEPLAPNLSARRAGMETLTVSDIAARIAKIQAEAGEDTVVLVEGAGGLLVRLNDAESFADLIMALGCPLVVVTSLGLGSLNSAELTVEAATRRGIPVLGLIGGSMPHDPDLATRLNIEELPQVTGVPLLGVLPEGLGQAIAKDFMGLVDIKPLLEHGK